MTREEKRSQRLEWAAIAVLAMSAALLVWIVAGAVMEITS